MLLIALVFTTRGLPLRGQSLKVSLTAKHHATLYTIIRLTLGNFAMYDFFMGPIQLKFFLFLSSMKYLVIVE